MNSIFAGLLALAAICGGMGVGVWLARRLPEQHLTGETGTAVSVAMAVVGTLAALVLGLMVNSANASFSARTSAIESLAAGVIKLNRTLLNYGPVTAPIRAELDVYVRAKARELSQPQPAGDIGLTTLHMLEDMNEKILRLPTAGPRDLHLQQRALALVEGVTDARWMLAEKTQVGMPTPFLILLVAWLSLLFANFGLFAPKNATVFTFLLLGATAIAGCIFIILELGSPTQGLIRPSAEPLIRVAEQLKLVNASLPVTAQAGSPAR